MPPENHISPPPFFKNISNSLNAASVIASGLCTTKISISSTKSLFKIGCFRNSRFINCLLGSIAFITRSNML